MELYGRNMQVTDLHLERFILPDKSSEKLVKLATDEKAVTSVILSEIYWDICQYYWDIVERM